MNWNRFWFWASLTTAIALVGTAFFPTTKGWWLGWTLFLAAWNFATAYVNREHA